jgi:hypothetical protein
MAPESLTPYLRQPPPSSDSCAALLAEYGAGNRSVASNRLHVRAEIPNMLNKLGLLGEAVEVGVRDGEHSFWILSHWKGKKLHVVDPWLHQDSKVYNDVSNVSLIVARYI